MSKKYVLLLTVFVVLYMLITLNTPPDPNTLARLGISALQLRLINLSLLIPVVAIWAIAFYGFSNVKDYASKIIGTRDGQAFNKLGNGLMVLAFSLPVSSLTSTALGSLARAYPDLTAATVITGRYISLGLAILAIAWIYQGAKSLAKLTTKKSVRAHYLWCGFAAVLMGAAYTYLALTNAASSVPDPATHQGVYYLPAWMIVTTVIIPYVFIWYFGLKSVVLIMFYRKHVSGVLYVRALHRLAIGIGLVVGTSVVSQLFTAISTQFIYWGLQSLLIFVYLLVVVIGIGYVFIALGAKKLKKIEEV